MEQPIFSDHQIAVTTGRVQWGTTAVALATVAGVSVQTVPSGASSSGVRAGILGVMAVGFGACMQDGGSKIALPLLMISLTGAIVFGAQAFTAYPMYAVVLSTSSGPVWTAKYRRPVDAQTAMNAVMHAIAIRQ